MNQEWTITRIMVTDGMKEAAIFHDLKSGKRSNGREHCECFMSRTINCSIDFRGFKEHRLVFEKWLEEQLIPELKVGQTVILDNATFHESQKIRELVELAGCEIQYLPPYSPDLNQIEHYWFPIKNRVRKSKGSIANFRERVDSAVNLAS